MLQLSVVNLVVKFWTLKIIYVYRHTLISVVGLNFVPSKTVENPKHRESCS